MINCPNCGAAIDIEKSKCPYCETPYIDLSNIDLDNSKPIILSIKYRGKILNTKAYLSNMSIDFNNDYITTRTIDGEVLKCCQGTHKTFHLELESY